MMRLSTVAVLGNALLGAQACDFDSAAVAMFNQTCAALVASPEAGYCTSGHPQSPFIGYICGTSCGLYDSYKSNYPNAYSELDNDDLFQQVEQAGRFTPTPGYAFYNNYAGEVDTDPNVPGKQINKFSCSQLQEVATFWGQPLSAFCTPVISAVCPASYDAICVPAGAPPKAAKSHCPCGCSGTLLGADSCDFDSAAIAMFGQTCAALMASPEAGYCTSGHPQSPFIGYICGTSCGLSETYKGTLSHAYSQLDNDDLFQQVMGTAGGGNRADTAPGPDSPYYEYYEDIVDADPNTPGKQISKFSCSQLQEAGTFWGTGLPGFCTPVVSAICPESYDAICVPAGYAAKAVSTECDLQCEGWCNQYTCDMPGCADCSRLDEKKCGVTGANDCDWWCNRYTCGSEHCSGCSVCDKVAADTQCAWWCNAHTMPGAAFPFDECNGCPPTTRRLATDERS